MGILHAFPASTATARFSAGSGCGIYGLSFGADTIIQCAKRAVSPDEKDIEKGLDKSDILCYNKYMQIISCR